MAQEVVAHQVLLHDTSLQAFLLFFPLLLLIVLYFATTTTTRTSKKQLNKPPSPPKLPLIGHLHLVGALPYVSLCNLAKKYGPDFMLLHLGEVPTLVISSPRAAQEILRTHDHVFASRPPSTVVDVLVYRSSDVAFSPYGEYWRQTKKLVTTHLLTVKKVHSYRHAREEEVCLVMAKVHEAAAVGATMDMSELLSSFMNDMVCRAVSGKFFREEGRNKLFQELIEANSKVLGGFNLEDYFPRLAKVGVLTRSLCTKAAGTRKRWDELLNVLIDDHASKLLRREDGASGSTSEQEESDFIDVLLSLQQEYGLTRDDVKGILMDMFVAGIDTSYVVLEFAMAELMRTQRVRTKLQDEVRRNTPKDQKMVTEYDLANMAYLKAVIKETLRLHPPVPLLLPHLSMADCVVDGYMIASGTRVVINAWALGRDARFWENAEEFMPERFIANGVAATVDFKGNDFQLVPFGAGRRICPGINFAMASVEIMLANLMYQFDWELPAGMEEKSVDLTEVFGLMMSRKEKLLIVPKLPTAGLACYSELGSQASTQ